eukprot:TRINITY_DN4293_c0_g1_i1.p1 TRINITY_DN4293_c0_g1~~TRINITY_DN4293_c0_g1_i1.p1  ORF type:complete len:57 (-),score=24.17 TRINITY_DN4293_c0_g1_i1:224-394(-)
MTLRKRKRKVVEEPRKRKKREQGAKKDQKALGAQKVKKQSDCLKTPAVKKDSKRKR